GDEAVRGQRRAAVDLQERDGYGESQRDESRDNRGDPPPAQSARHPGVHPLGRVGPARQRPALVEQGRPDVILEAHATTPIVVFPIRPLPPLRSPPSQPSPPWSPLSRSPLSRSPPAPASPSSSRRRCMAREPLLLTVPIEQPSRSATCAIDMSS